ncbi:MAG TPA: transposase [Candidatus Acidoferrales bacterium]|nr:transposase [Candidatus Acidoferrales bacterium]
MGMGRKKDREKQQDLWVTSSEIVSAPGHVFYERLNAVLEAEKFDQRIETICRKYYKSSSGRPSITPGTYFRMLLLGYFEGIDSERGIAWRAADSFSFRKFLGYDLIESTPDHSTVSRTRRLYSVQTHRAVMKWVLKILRKHGLADAQSVCIDATTLAANASMKSLVRRDTGVSYDEYLKQLAEAEGIENPTKEQAARLDRKRKKKASNDDWTNPNDPSARITKMKDGRTKLAYKAEHAVDLASGALLAVTVQPADRGDTTSYPETLDAAQQEAKESHPAGIEEVVMDKGYHSGAVMVELAEREIRSYVPEPERGKRKWSGKATEQRCVYANRRRVRAERSKRLQKLRGELCERSFAHCYETGAMRRMYVRGEDNVNKRVLVQAAAFNIGLLLRKLSGWGKPRQGRGSKNGVLAPLCAAAAVQSVFRALRRWATGFSAPVLPRNHDSARLPCRFSSRVVSATGC